jgi:hypothetical protein
MTKGSGKRDSLQRVAVGATCTARSVSEAIAIAATGSEHHDQIEAA